MAERSEDERKEIRGAFREVANMSPKELEEWLETEEVALGRRHGRRRREHRPQVGPTHRRAQAQDRR